LNGGQGGDSLHATSKETTEGAMEGKNGGAPTKTVVGDRGRVFWIVKEGRARQGKKKEIKIVIANPKNSRRGEQVNWAIGKKRRGLRDLS